MKHTGFWGFGVFRDLLENEFNDPSKATHRRVARFKETRS